MTRTARAMLGAIVLIAAFGWISAAGAQQPERMNVRGTVEKVDGSNMIVKSREGADLVVKLSDNLTVRGLVKVSLADVKPGSYVGVSAMPGSDGTDRAMHIHIFPEAMRGAGEGHRPFDLRPGSTMTNAAVDTTVVGTSGHVVTVKYKDGEKKFVVPADAPIVAYVPGTRDELKPGAKIMIFNAVKQPDGTLQAAAVSVGRDGLTPPM
ncbi:MAG TPA: hypothetical protein VJL90_00495 [Pseudorhodoplanes sp.]|nr:hypothetical protein [Pseudorhodoplanes sp.]